jgi:SAM-dependent methyltransferase
MVDYREYYFYLRQRSRAGYIYRRYWLYPRISSYLHGRTLDVGCGIGDFLRYYKIATGVDINPLMVAFCRENGFNVQQMTPDALPFYECSFDSVMFDNVLEHLSDPRALLREIYRVVVKDGTLVVGVPGQRGFTEDVDHKKFYDRELLASTLADSGFRLWQHFYMPFKSNWLNLRIRQYCLYGVFKRV